MHLLAVIKAHDRDDNFENMLSGIRLLHTLCELASHHSKLDQVRDLLYFSKELDFTMCLFNGIVIREMHVYVFVLHIVIGIAR